MEVFVKSSKPNQISDFVTFTGCRKLAVPASSPAVDQRRLKRLANLINYYLINYYLLISDYLTNYHRRKLANRTTLEPQ